MHSANNQLENIQHKKNTLQTDFDLLFAHYTESELYASIVRQSPNAIMMMDAGGNILSVNKGFVDMYEYNFREFTSKLGKNYKQTSFSPDVQDRIYFVQQTKNPFRYEALNVTKTGKQLWTQTALVLILNDEGKVINMATIDTDIDQRVIKSDQLIIEMEQLNVKINQLSNEFQFLGGEFKRLFQNINELYLLIEKTDQILNFIKEISKNTLKALVRLMKY